MANTRVLIHYSPKLYSELFSSILQLLCGIEIIEPEPENNHPETSESSNQEADLIILSLDENNQPLLENLPIKPGKSKVLAFSPKGNYGLRRMPHTSVWEELSPFGLDHLIREVIILGPKTFNLSEQPTSAQ
jgi:hypothetical protein